jgi:hypothetical protein
MMDMLALLASLWKQYNLVYTTKSAIVEWLIHEKDVAPYSNLPNTTIFVRWFRLDYNVPSELL